jgi:hypothetical protein
MHPYVEIIFSTMLILFGILMVKKLKNLRALKRMAIRRSYAAERYSRLLFKKLSFRLTIVIFTLALTLVAAILIEKNMMSVSW